MDIGLPGADPHESNSAQVPEGPRGQLLRDSSAITLLLPPAQSSPCCRRYVAPFNTLPFANILVAYTIYAFFEWALVLLDVGFDAVTMIEFQHLEVVIKDVRGVSRLYVPRLPI